MRTGSAVGAELSKLLSLPAAWFAVVAGIVVSAGVTILSSGGSASTADTGFSSLALGVAGAIALGVIIVSSEYAVEGQESGSSQQITATLAATPSRIRVLLAKTFALSLMVSSLAVVTIVVVFILTGLLMGGHAPEIDGDAVARMAGMVLYWELVALLAFGLTLLTRNGVIPMVVLIANFSAVPVTYLLTRVTTLANYLPDTAGMRLWARELDTGVQIAPVLGGIIMITWVLVLLVIAFTVFVRRDA
jgi:hypothetical protein